MNHHPSTWKTRLAVALVPCLLGQASAALIVYDGFDYPTGPIAGVGTWTNGGLGEVASPGLSYVDSSFSQLATTGNRLDSDLVDNTSFASFRELGQSYSTVGQTIYISFLARIDENVEGPRNRFAGVSLMGSGTEHYFMGAGGGSGTWAIDNKTSIGNSSVGVTNVAFLVYRLDFTVGGPSSGTTSLFINPNLSDIPAVADVTIANGDAFSFDQIRVHAGGFGENSLQAFQVDEIRIGTTWQDVTTAIPEPHVALVGAGGVLAGLLRRRRA